MRDTFTNIIPLYTHQPKTCFVPSMTHVHHRQIKRDVEGKPLRSINREYYHKMDFMKEYSEEMYKLQSFAPLAKTVKK